MKSAMKAERSAPGEIEGGLSVIRGAEARRGGGLVIDAGLAPPGEQLLPQEGPDSKNRSRDNCEDAARRRSDGDLSEK